MMTPEQTAATHPPTCPINVGVLASVCHHCVTGEPFTDAQMDEFAWERALREATYPPGVSPGPFVPIPAWWLEHQVGREKWLENYRRGR
jgi:hypothetical protein